MGPGCSSIDNYDSFVYNLVQELGELGAEPVVYRNDAIDVAGIRAAEPDAVLISPGPGRPEDGGISMTVVDSSPARSRSSACASATSASARSTGAKIVGAPHLMHGKTSAIHHDGKGVFAGLPNPFVATRYHSLVVEPATVPDELEVTATPADGVVMGLRHRNSPSRGCSSTRVVPHTERAAPPVELPRGHHLSRRARGGARSTSEPAPEPAA